MSDTPENSKSNQIPGRFKPGQSGNPAGKPKGARHRTTMAIEALLEGQAEALTQKAIEMALSGDGVAMRLVLDRLVPPRRDRHIAIELPPVKTATDATAASGKIVDAVASGEITPNDGAEVGKILDVHVRNIELREFEERLAALEGKSK